ncbi:RNA helicase [Arachnia propionica]|uniref:DUF3516 domain-containing protein n=1 Tax=Arachnia propionica TaxID=1750 RepID=A0A3P1X0E0_9ACTN|nr:DEAD/DEAH box helicase [Arachnia propionica]RRD51437.1 DUF3516 domain-containing protein [Arachnia propionica]
MTTLTDLTPTDPTPDALFETFTAWVEEQGITLYPHQEESLLAILAGDHAIVTTPTGSGKSLIALGAHFAALAEGRRTYYTAPIKALVNEKFFALCDAFGADNVGMVTGDASVNADAPVICCTAEILANLALREGRGAEVGQVVMDEFHFLADPDRGWAWLVPLVELPQAQFVIMSATLGDVTRLASDLTDRTGRETAVIGGVTRPVPLTYRWALTPIHETIAEIVATHQAPVYIVHSTQGAAVDQATALLSQGVVRKASAAVPQELKEALAGFPFAGGFGQTLAKLLRGGIGVHHAGMLPRYRRLVEQLAQRGLLAVICGTDTLGVGINVPIRTVLFSALTKFDGRRSRVLRSREFHQIAGRAGRAGFDTLGNVVAQAPEHEVENARILAKFEGDEKKLRSVRRKKPPEGFVNYTEATFTKLIESTPESLNGRMRITHALLLNLLQRDEATSTAVTRLVDATGVDGKARRALLRRAVQLGRSLLRAGVVTRLKEPTPGGRRHELNVDLQRDFALNQPLSAFALAVIETLDDQSPDHALDVVSVIEATLEDPRVLLLAQQFKARGEAMAEMKADGWEYDERMEALEEVTWPQPLADMLEQAHLEYSAAHPWLVETPVHPKSVVRDMYQQGMTFGEYVAHYKLQRTEGVLLRYLTDAYRALRQTVPESLRTEELEDLIDWLGASTRLVDSSLLDEWSELANLAGLPVEQRAEAAQPARPVTGNARAFRVMVRNAMWRRVELCADDDVEALAALTSGDPMTRRRWDEALGDYWDEHEDIGVGQDARGPAFFVVETKRGGRLWEVRQILDDPAGNRDWSILATVDLDECDEAGELVLRTLDLSRLDG